jgi:hypothetical protein
VWAEQRTLFVVRADSETADTSVPRTLVLNLR